MMMIIGKQSYNGGDAKTQDDEENANANVQVEPVGKKAPELRPTY